MFDEFTTAQEMIRDRVSRETTTARRVPTQLPPDALAQLRSSGRAQRQRPLGSPLAPPPVTGEEKRARVLIDGRVQGVFFRASTQTRARALRLGGWVRNRPDGSVEAVFEGDSAAVEQMLEWCQNGPAHSKVEDVKVSYEEPQPPAVRGPRQFFIRR